MDILNTPKILQRAIHTLDDAITETSRPKEDVVTYSVCSKLRNSTYDFLSCYLMVNHVHFKENMTISEMKNLCGKIDSSFNELHFSYIPCFNEGHDHNDSYCQEVNVVNKCLIDVEKTKNLVVNNSKIKNIMNELHLQS